MSAIISACGLYRYRLDRQLTPKPAKQVIFVMLNPSTADAEQDDPTIRKCKGFARQWGCSLLTVVNLFAYRATYPTGLSRAMRDGVNIVGWDNAEHLARALGEGDLVVAAWGSRVEQWPWALERARAVLSGNMSTVFRQIGAPVGKTHQPRHPLMAPYALELERIWR